MSDTPICDFVKEYIEKKPLRFHMPGHKGKKRLGCEPLDVTEIDGADSLFEASGIIAQSEANASALFGCPTFYSTEGSSLCVRAMLYLASTCGKGRTVLAARNVHKSFLYASALLDLNVEWIRPTAHPKDVSRLSSAVTSQTVAEALDNMPEKPCCVYLTCPDYLGLMCDVLKISEVCHARGVLLLVDCAHGAYLRLISSFAIFPTDVGADLVCSSAHKTLPVLTGGAYLHIGNAVKDLFVPRVKEALALFASTSPSYLILQSLDAANVLMKDLASAYSLLCDEIENTAERLQRAGYDYCTPNKKRHFSSPDELFGDLFDHADLISSEYCKLTLLPKSYGYSGDELSDILISRNVYPEFHDPDHVVFMLTPQNGGKSLKTLEDLLLSIPRREAIGELPPPLPVPERVMSVREALFSASEKLPVEKCLGRVLHDPSVSCPPAVPIVMCGERIDEKAIACFAYFGVRDCSVVRTI